MRERSEMRVMALAAAQHACVTAAQLAAAGIGRRAIDRRIADGRLRRLHRGVYLVGPIEPPHARAMAALLAVGPHAALSHRSAAAVWAILPPTDETIDVTVTDRGPRSRKGIRVRHTQSLLQGEVRRRHQMALTSPERTLVDLAASLPPHTLERATEEARVLRLVTSGTLAAAIGRHRRRPGTPSLEALLHAHTPLLIRSEAERRLLDLIRAAALPEPRTNVRVGRHEVDMLWPAERLVVEVDGFAFHSTRAAFERDRTRDAELQARGYRVIRVTWRQIETEPHAIVARLAAALVTAVA